MKTALLTTFLIFQVFFGFSQPQATNNAKAVAISEDANASKDASATPAYPGGNTALLNYISKNVKYPEMAREEKTEGSVTVRFLVDIDGTVKNATVPKGKGIGNGCDEEAVRVVMTSQKWKPAVKNGTPVAIWYEVPIVFALNAKK